jgi:hypothetical protein
MTDQPENPPLSVEQLQSSEEARRQLAAKKAFESIWRKFGENRKKGRTSAFSILLQDLTKHASDLVPYYMTAKEFMGIISEIESHTKGDTATSTNDDPLELMSKWIRGEVQLSKVPLEKVQ